MNTIKPDIFEKALELVNGPKQDEYGTPEANFSRIALFWSAYLSNKEMMEIKISEKDVAAMFMLHKLSRLMHAYKEDSAVDFAGYLALFDFFWKRENEFHDDGV